MILTGHDEAVANWAGQRLGCTFCPPVVAIGRLSQDGTLIGAAVYCAYTGPNIEMSVYAPNRAFQSRWWRYCVWSYPYEELGVLRVTMRTRRSNKQVRLMLEKLGTFEGVQKRFFGPSKADDAFVFGIFPDHARKYARVRNV